MPSDQRRRWSRNLFAFRGTRRRYLWYLLSLVVLSVVGGELVLRYLGFGDPPLYVVDPKIEYYPKPGNYRRYGNWVHVNRFGMRSPELRPRRDQVRVLLIGDSIVFGTYRVAQDELVSTSLEPELARLLHTDVEVLNAASSSWGPENQLAYLERFGAFDADVAVLLLSSHDATDVPTPGFAHTLPQVTRALAILEILDLLEQKRFQGPPPPGNPLERSLSAVKRIVALTKAAGLPLLAVSHWSTVELVQGQDPGGLQLQQVFDSVGVPLFSLRQTLKTAQERGATPYQDALHLSPAGARIVGTAIADELYRQRASLLVTAARRRPPH